MYGELEGSWGRPDLGYTQGGGRGGVSDFTSNLSRSKSFRYSMARGLGGREVMGMGGDDIVFVDGGTSKNVSLCVSGLIEGPHVTLSAVHRRQDMDWMSFLCKKLCVPVSVSLAPSS